MTEITTLKVTDWQMYKELRLKALEESPLAFTSTLHEALNKVAEDWQNYLKGDNSITLFAKKGDQLAGMVAAVFNDKKRTSHVAEIVGNYVAPNFRGKGIGSKLFEAILKAIDQREQITKIILSVASTQKPAISLYKKYGFRVVGTHKKHLQLNNHYYDLVLMEKLF